MANELERTKELGWDFDLVSEAIPMFNLSLRKRMVTGSYRIHVLQ
jgi:hypothetical protein